ncbi:MAG: hypothetical protein F8N37_17845 [Telmatospirillum sp.]|nr:hypothetical protein [Telmatospirillum sp.]
MDKPFDILQEYAKFGRDQHVSLQDPETATAFIAHVQDSIHRALSDAGLLHGQRVEAMFQSLLVSLSGFTLLKVEDGGPVFSDGPKLRAPDLRVVLKDGRHWLIEVKNVYAEDPSLESQAKELFNAAYYRSLADYAKATRAELKVAIFWARWQIWTLVSPDRLLGPGGEFQIDMGTAMKVNEMAALGDRTIATQAPLTLRLVGDPEYGGQIGQDGVAPFRTEEVQIFAAGQQLTDPVEREIASVLMMYGEWEVEQENEVEGDQLKALVFVWSPAEQSDLGFDTIGNLSRMFARYYAGHTVEDKAIVQLHAPIRPNWFAPLLKWNAKGSKLPLWQFILQPNYDEAADDGHHVKGAK